MKDLATQAKLHEARAKRFEAFSKIPKLFIPVVNSVERGVKALKPFANDQKHTMGSHTTSGSSHTDEEMQAVREAGNAMGVLMEQVRAAFEEAEVEQQALEPDERLLKSLQVRHQRERGTQPTPAHHAQSVTPTRHAQHATLGHRAPVPQDLYLAHDLAVEALTTSVAAVKDIMKRFEKSKHKTKLVAEVRGACISCPSITGSSPRSFCCALTWARPDAS